MLISEMLNKIREPWLTRISHEISKGEAGREAILDELNRFYDLLLQAVESGDSGWLKPVLIEWATTRTESELSRDEITIAPVLAVIVEKTIEVANETLTPEQTIELITELLPYFTFAYGQIAQQEALVRIGYISTKLEIFKNELERLDRSKSDFIAVAAHELKTPLTLIEGYTAMIREQFAEEDSQSSATMMLNGIDNGVGRLGEIIDDMIDISMIDNGLLELNYQPTWLNRLIDVLLKEVEETLLQRNQKITVNDFSGYKEMTFADSERVYQALKNILNNAIKYTPDGGKIVIDGRRTEGFIEITIADSGIGIDIEDQLLIFEKFGRLGSVALHSSGKTKFKGGGPGLGLPITRGILEAHGGTIWVESDGYDEEAMRGSKFHVLLPMRDEAPDDSVTKLFESQSEDQES